jgi:hypothetical protein
MSECDGMSAAGVSGNAGDQPTDHRKLALLDCWSGVACRQPDDAVAAVDEEGGRASVYRVVAQRADAR